MISIMSKRKKDMDFLSSKVLASTYRKQIADILSNLPSRKETRFPLHVTRASLDTITQEPRRALHIITKPPRPTTKIISSKSNPPDQILGFDKKKQKKRTHTNILASKDTKKKNSIHKEKSSIARARSIKVARATGAAIKLRARARESRRIIKPGAGFVILLLCFFSPSPHHTGIRPATRARRGQGVNPALTACAGFRKNFATTARAHSIERKDVPFARWIFAR